MNYLKNNYPRIVNWVIITSIIFTLFNNKTWNNEQGVIEWDVISYYAFLPAAFIYHDLSLDFTENYQGNHKFTIWYETNKDGNKVLLMSMGLSYLYAPFFFLGHIMAMIMGYDAGGYSMPYRFFILFSGVFYLSIGLYFLRKILLQYFSNLVTTITTITLVYATNLFWYTSLSAPMPHGYNFTLFVLFIYFTIQWYKKQSLLLTIFLGALLGLISLIRPTNIIILLFFIFFSISSFKDFPNRILFLLKKYRYILLMMLSFLIVWLPQLLYWKKTSGSFFYYSYGEKGNFYFNNPQIIAGLFGFRKGLFLYTPVMLLAISGFFLLRKRMKDFFIPIILFFILFTYVILSWWCWWYGGSYGNRAFIESFALLSIPLAVTIEYGIKKKKYILYMIICLFNVHGIYQTLQYKYGAIHYDSMSKEAYMNSFGKLFPSAHFYYLLKIPDYEKAMQGIQSYISPVNDTIDFEKKHKVKSLIFCDAETIQGNLFKSQDTTNFFEGIHTISTKKYYSSSHSVKVNKKNPFSFTITLDSIKPNERYKISVKRTGSNYIGYLVAAEDIPNGFYYSYQYGRKTEKKDWNEIQLNFIIPEYSTGSKMKIYVWNPERKKVYFDDIKIIRFFD